MKYSIIVPVFRVENYLEECLNSILKQNYSDYEILLIDDGSDDRCPEICDMYSQKYQNVKVIHKINEGLVSARKVGAKAARGEYILNIDSDDWISPDYLTVIDDAVKRSMSADIVIWGTTLCKGNEKKELRIWENRFGLYTGEKLNLVRHSFLYDKRKVGVNSGSVSINLVTKAVKRELYQEFQNQIDNSVNKGEDALLSLYLLLNCSSVYYVDFYGYYYRVVENSMSKKVSPQDFSKLDYLVKTMFDVDPKDMEIDNQIKAYALWRIIGILSLLSKSVNSIEEFKLVTHEINIGLIDISSSARISKRRIKDYIKIFLLKNRYWYLLYSILKRI